MKPPTRQLVLLLADDTIARLTASLRDRPLTAPQLGKATGASEKTVAHALELLQAHGIVECQPAETAGTPGRPSRLWTLAATDELAAFDRACDNFKELILRRQLNQYEQGEIIEETPGAET
jgi:predicted ArsR family transcriptional regulator